MAKIKGRCSLYWIESKLYWLLYTGKKKERERSWQHLSLKCQYKYSTLIATSENKEIKFRQTNDVISIKRKRTIHLTSLQMKIVLFSENASFQSQRPASSFVSLNVKCDVTMLSSQMANTTPRVPLFHCEKEFSAVELWRELAN